MKDSDLQRIRHIQTYCEDIADTIERFGENYDVFAQDKDFSNSVSMSLMQIGELSAGLTDDFKNATRNHIQWGAIKGMRNLFAHAYISMNKSVIWETATRDAPAVLDFCNSVLMQFDEEQEQAPGQTLSM